MTSTMRARLRPMARRATAFVAGAGLLASGLAATTLMAAAPANAEDEIPYIACTWIRAGGLDNRENTTRCWGPGAKAERVVHRDCWKYEPPADTKVRVKRGKKWFRTDIDVVIRKGGNCPESHPWLTRVKIPTEGLKPFQIVRYRLAMPAHEVTVGDEVIEVDRTSLNMYVCMMREDREREC